jgi:ATP-binding cassette subfamily B protein/ATP-binding cassette subfamily B multidrug efflux pump
MDRVNDPLFLRYKSPGFITIGEFTAAVYVLNRLSGHTFSLLQMGQHIFQAIGTIKDAMPITTTPPTIIDKPGEQSLMVPSGEIRFDSISFSYKVGKPVIDNLLLTIRTGEKFGLPGAGKTTLASLFLRFYDIN